MTLERQATVRGLGVIASGLALTTLATALADASGLKYAQRFVWPTDTYAFEHGSIEGVDVAMVGSSRVGFDLAPTAIDACLGEAIGRPTRSVNLARRYATAFSVEMIARDLLDGARRPKVLLFGVEPEAMNARNHQSAENTPSHASLTRVPTALVEARSWSEMAGALRTLGRGPENVAAYVAGASDTDPRLRWLMLYMGGGAWCFHSDECTTQNERQMRVESTRWDIRVAEWIPEITEERFTRFEVGSGINHDAMVRLVAWARANDVTLALVDMPLHPIFRHEIPDAVDAEYQRYLDALAAQWDLALYRPDTTALAADRAAWVDPDHLSPTGALVFSEAVCRDLLAPLLRGER
jgi:hypothetical protein